MIARLLRSWLAVLLIPWSASEGAIDAYFYLTGGRQTIEEPVQILGFSKGTENNINIGSVTSGGGAGIATAQVATISLAPNRAVTEMFRGLVAGDDYQMKFIIQRAGSTSLLGEVSFDFVMFSDLMVNAASGNDIPEVQISFQYGAMFWTEYYPINAKGDLGSDSSGWSFITNTSVTTDFFDGGGDPPPPTNPDTDSDGMPNVWEEANGLNKDVKDGSTDLDGDKMTNLEEYIAGTNPRSASSFFKTRIDVTTGAIELQWHTETGRIYRVSQSTSLSNGFTLLTEITDAVSGTKVYRPAAGTGPYYRVEALMAP